VKRSVIGAFLCWALVASPAPCAAGREMLLAGNEAGLWLVRSSPEDATHDVVARPTDRGWQWVAKSVNGRPTAAAVTGNQLHLLLSRPLGYLVYSLTAGLSVGPQPDDARWPDEAPVAVCSAKGMGQDQAAGVIAVVARPATGIAKASATKPGRSRPAARAETGRKQGQSVRLGVFRKLGSKWSHLTDYGQTLAPQAGRLLATAAGGSLFVLLGGGDGRQDVLLALTGTEWRRISIADWPKGSHAVGMLSVRDRAVIVLADKAGPAGEAPADTPARSRLLLAIYNPQQRSFSLQPTVRDGSEILWDLPEPPLVARLAEGVALVRQDQTKLTLDQCGLNGQVYKSSEIGVFQHGPPDQRGQEVLSVFMWGLLLAILAPMFLLRPKTPPRPFSLPVTMRPANPVKRILAATLDFLPWAAISWLIWRIEPVAPDELWEQLTESGAANALPASYAYFVVTARLSYAAYCIIMERRFGATVGKMIFKMRVVGDEGIEPGLREVLLRNLVRTFELSWPLVAIPILLMVFTRNRQRLGDMMGRTTVIDAAFVPPQPPQEQPARKPTEQDESPYHGA